MSGKYSYVFIAYIHVSDSVKFGMCIHEHELEFNSIGGQTVNCRFLIEASTKCNNLRSDPHMLYLSYVINS